MSNFYLIIPEKRVPIEELTYSFELPLNVGDLVEIPLRKQLVTGVVSQVLTKKPDLPPELIKQVRGKLPISYSPEFLAFLKTFSFSTFNNLNLVFSSSLSGLKAIGKKSLQSTEATKSAVQILLVFPEIKLLDNYLLKIQNLFVEDKHKTNSKISILKYTADKSATSKNTVVKILNASKKINLQIASNKQPDFILENNEMDLLLRIIYLIRTVDTKYQTSANSLKIDEIQLIFSTRSGIFLPFNNLDSLIIVDEANPLYIQEQNQIYYDVRDAAYVMLQTNCQNLFFVSRHPSVRLLNFYSKESLQTWEYSNTKNDPKLVNLQISKRNSKIDSFDIFSDHIEQEITNSESLVAASLETDL